MAQFTIVEHVNMHFIYGFHNGIARAASREYQCKYPGWKQPNRHLFAMVHCSVKKTDKFMPPPHVGCDRHNIQNDKKVLDAVHANPLTSTYWVAHETESSLTYTERGGNVSFSCSFCRRVTARGQ
jgi:hypothetical protein